MPSNANYSTNRLPAFISRQVLESRHFFFNLEPRQDSEFEIVCGGVEQVSSEYFIERGDFPFFGIELVTAGTGLVTINSQPAALSAGSLFAYGPSTPHRIQNSSSQGMKKYYLDLYGSSIPQHLTDAHLYSNDGIFTPIWVTGVHELANVFEMLIHEANRPRDKTMSICKNLTELLFLKIQQLRLSDGSHRSKAYDTFEQICLYIDEHFINLKSAKDIAKKCQVTPVYLSRLFNRFSGNGAYHYLLHRKMNFAANLLVDESITVKEAADRIGIQDPFQFSRSFKRVCGYPPSRLTRAHR